MLGTMEPPLMQLSVNVFTATIHASKSARNLEIVFDDNLCMDQHVKRVCRALYFHIRNVRSIFKILTGETASTTIHALITSGIDNGNSLLTWITDRFNNFASSNSHKIVLLVFLQTQVNLIT